MFKSKKVKRYEALYIDIAKRIAEMSFAKKMKVGCVLVKDDNILSYGFNGAPARFNNECEDSDGNTLPHVLHAESNCLMKIAKVPMSCEGATIYCTHSPCMECSKLIAQAGITRVIYNSKYKEDSGFYLLKSLEIEVEQYYPPKDLEKK
jgi:dCMP deaminase